MSFDILWIKSFPRVAPRAVKNRSKLHLLERITTTNPSTGISNCRHMCSITQQTIYVNHRKCVQDFRRRLKTIQLMIWKLIKA